MKSIHPLEHKMLTEDFGYQAKTIANDLATEPRPTADDYRLADILLSDNKPRIASKVSLSNVSKDADRPPKIKNTREELEKERIRTLRLGSAARRISRSYNENEVQEKLKDPDSIWVDWDWYCRKFERRVYDKDWFSYDFPDITYGYRSSSEVSINTGTTTKRKGETLLHLGENIESVESSFYTEEDKPPDTTDDAIALLDMVSETQEYADVFGLNFLGIKLADNNYIQVDELPQYIETQITSLRDKGAPEWLIHKLGLKSTISE